ncbi:MAG: isochorismate synthase [Candidatus Hydrogenedentota bacterium]
MTAPILYPGIVESAAAKRTLASLLEQAFESTTRPSTGRRVLRVEVPVEGVDPLTWLYAQGQRSRGYWCGRDRDYELAGVGTADILTAETDCDYDALFERLHEGISSVHPHLRYYGGMRFSLRHAPSEKWKPFGAYRFVLPRFEVLSRGNHTYFACNAMLDSEASDLLPKLLEGLDAMPFPGSPGETDTPPALSRTDVPNASVWDTEVGRALAAMREGKFEKVVLARETRFEFPAPVDPVALLRRLSATARPCYRFCFQPKAGAAFVGVSPERLYKRQDRFIRSEAVAGTRPCTGDDARDAALGDELLRSEKDIREHRLVLDVIRDELAARCHASHADDSVTVLRTERCQHLYAQVEGILHHFNTDAELLAGLHPTPAVGGYPKEAALRWIADAEDFDRGWYSGPVGWVGCDSAEFAVAIRSALVTDDRVSVYSGAGIIDGSEPRDEWGELEHKISQFVSLFESA